MDEAETVTLTKDEVKTFFKDWEHRYRMGLCISQEESDAKDLDVVAADNTENFWRFVNRGKDTLPTSIPHHQV